MSEFDKLKRKTLLQESIRQALADGLINDESLAYIRALGYAWQQKPNDPRIYEAIRETLRSIQNLYVKKENINSQEQRQRHAELAKEKLGEGLSDNFGRAEYLDEHLAVTVPSRIINYLERQRLLLIPLEIRKSTIAEAGKCREFRYRFLGQENTRQMYALDKHWIGLYFCGDSPHQNEPGEHETTRASEPVLVDNTTFTFVDTNLRGSNIDLFYQGMRYPEAAEGKAGRRDILYLNLIFKNCWVKNMNLQFWHYIFHFPGTITVMFENCEDFSEAYFPYLQKETGGNRYYLDLEKLAHKIGHLASDGFLQNIAQLLQIADSYQYEHLR